jgi:hypothetical protein
LKPLCLSQEKYSKLAAVQDLINAKSMPPDSWRSLLAVSQDARRNVAKATIIKSATRVQTKKYENPLIVLQTLHTGTIIYMVIDEVEATYIHVAFSSRFTGEPLALVSQRLGK